MSGLNARKSAHCVYTAPVICTGKEGGEIFEFVKIVLSMLPDDISLNMFLNPIEKVYMLTL